MSDFICSGCGEKMIRKPDAIDWEGRFIGYVVCANPICDVTVRILVTKKDAEHDEDMRSWYNRPWWRTFERRPIRPKVGET